MIKYFKKYISYAVFIFFGVLAFNFFNTITVSAATGTQTGQSEAFFQTNSGQDILIAPITVNGEVGYCYNAYLSTPTGEEYSLLRDAYEEPTVLGALFYGFAGFDRTLQYKYGIPDNQARYATGVVITQHAHDLGIPHNYDALKYANLKPNAHPNLLKYAQELYTKRFNRLQPITLTFNGNTSVQGNYQVSDVVRLSSSIEYNVTVNAGEVIEKTANSFKVRVPMNYAGEVTATVKPITKDFKGLVWKTGNGKQDIVQLNKKDPLRNVSTALRFNAVTSTVKIVKTDELGRKVPGVVFEISRERTFSNNPFTATTNAQGEIVDAGWALTPTSKVYVREKSVPNHLVKSDEVKEVQLVAGQTATVSFVNNLKRGHLELVKVDGENNNTKLENSVFELLQNNTVIDTATSNAEGKVLFNDLLPGNYIVREKTAPVGYRLNTNTLNVTIEPGKTNKQNFKNYQIKGNVEVLKLAAHNPNLKLQGAIFALKKGNNTVAIATTNNEGIARFNHVPFGEYTLVETSAPNGYFFTQLEKQVIINAHDQVIAFTIDNEKAPTIQTTAYGNGEKIIEAVGIITLTDIVKYTDLIPGKEYEAVLTWMNQKTNSPLLVNGKPLKVIKTFTPTESNGTVELSVEVDAGVFSEDTTTVAFEILYKDKIEVAAHTDINDKDQTVKIIKPSIKTKAHGENKKVQEVVEPSEKVVVEETAEIFNTIKDHKYKTTITFFSLDTKEVLETRTVEFTATGDSHTIKEKFVVDGFKHNKGVSFSESLEKFVNGKWKLIAEHNKEYNDADQTVRFKKYGSIEVKKVDSATGELIKATMKFGLFRNGELIEEMFTVEGKAKFKTKLIIDPKIVYEVKELEAPERYIKSDEVLKVVLTEEDAHQVKEFSYNNTLLPTIKTKIDSSDNANVMIYTIAGFISFVGLFLLKRNKD